MGKLTNGQDSFQCLRKYTFTVKIAFISDLIHERL